MEISTASHEFASPGRDGTTETDIEGAVTPLPAPGRGRGRPRKTGQVPSDDGDRPPRSAFWSDDDRLLTVDEVAEILRMRPKTLRYYKTQFPERVPPWIHFPGSRPPLWRLRDVRAWIERGVAEGEKERAKLEEMRQEGLYPFPKKKRGRPSKREMLETARGGH